MADEREPQPPPIMRSRAESEAWPPVHPPLAGPALELDLLADFVPACPDCKYDLAGLNDGRCPECGLPFTHPDLRRLWVARKRVRQARMSLILPAAFSLTTLLGYLFPLGKPWGFGAAMTLWMAIGAVYAWRSRDWLIARPYVLLVFLLPLMLTMFVVSATPLGRWPVRSSGASRAPSAGSP